LGLCQLRQVDSTVLVAIDKFTKWIKVKPVTCPKDNVVLDFFDELVHRY
jgi:hypothetical protein